MKYWIPLSICIFLLACNSEPHKDLSAQELLDMALEKAEEEGLSNEDLMEAKSSEGMAEPEQIEEKEVDSIQLILEQWHRDFRVFNNVGYPRHDSIQDKNFSGIYGLQEGDYNFKVSFRQTGAHIRGTYCGYTNTRSDCGMPSQGVAAPLVKGRVLGDTLHLYYYSNYGNAFGRAKAYFKEDTLIWKATETPEAQFIGTPNEGKLILEGSKMEESEIWPEPMGC